MTTRPQRMAAWITAAAAVGALFAVAVAASAKDEPPASDRGQSLPRDAPIAILGGPATRSLTRVDPITLEPAGRKARLGEYHDTYSFSPDGAAIAFGLSAPNEAGAGRVGIRLVNTRDLRVTGNIATGIFAAGVAWLEPRRLVAVLGDSFRLGPSSVVIVDPPTGAILERFQLPASCDTSEVPGRALLSLARGSLSVVRSDGTAETLGLPRAFEECGQIATRSGNGVAFVVAAGGAVVAEVALPSSEVTVHRLGREHVGDEELVVGLGRRRLLLALRGPSGRFSDGRPDGVALLDVEARSREIVDRAAGEVRVSGGTLLAYEGKPFAQGSGLGVRAYGLDGRRRFHLLKGRHIADVEAAGRFAYAVVGGGGVAIIDTRSGAVVGRSTSRFHGDLLTDPSSP